LLFSGDCNVHWSVTVSNADRVKWFSPSEEISGENEEFEIEISGPKDAEKHVLVFGEVYPDDIGEYKVTIEKDGESKSVAATLNGKFNP